MLVAISANIYVVLEASLQSIYTIVIDKNLRNHIFFFKTEKKNPQINLENNYCVRSCLCMISHLDVSNIVTRTAEGCLIDGAYSSFSCP